MWNKNRHVKKLLTLEIRDDQKRIPLLLPKVSVMINSIMKIFLPKDRVFYQLFEEVAVKVLEMSRKLKEVVHEPDYDKRSAIASQIEELEHVNDDLTHKIFTELGRNFITPFDREDIHYLESALDDIADYIFASSKKIKF